MCTMAFEGAYGELVGPRRGGMRAAFTMMNAARLSIGVQGPAVGERAYQQAHEYAAARVQGRVTVGGVPPGEAGRRPRRETDAAPREDRHPGQQGAPLRHGPVRRPRRPREHPDDRERGRQFADLLTPVAKAWSTDLGFTSVSLGIQVLGGAGYIEETGTPQRLRDAHIGPIYEGTNDIQPLDLVTRKLGRDGTVAAGYASSSTRWEGRPPAPARTSSSSA
jgi:alkylation response protein AidB-like acyl-CoA dehydrogenase